MVKCDKDSMTKAIAEIKDNEYLKNIGFRMAANGDHKKLNDLLKHADVEIKATQNKRVKINGVV